jgi:serine/threonine protein kinase
VTLTQCPRCGTPLNEGATACTACGWMATDPTMGTVVATSEEKRSIGLRSSDELMLAPQQDFLLTQLQKELADHYEVEKELGRGGMAVVYKAVEKDLHRTVALKVLPPGMGGAMMAERFKREARMAASLDHPNIIPVYRVGQAAGTFFFAMKFVEGRAVDAIVESQGALAIPVVLQILRGASSALAFAHERGIVHRDIKGANILVDKDGRVLVSDFGIARAAEEKTLTASGSVIGTPHFMSPEQCSGSKAAPQSDQYSLGVLAFQMLTGSVPFDADSLMGILQHHFFTPVPDIAAVRKGVPPLLLSVVHRVLSKDPTERFGNTRDMLQTLEQVPFTDSERREADQVLEKLAVGAPVPRIRTGSLPPLQDTRLSGGATLARVSSAPTVTGPAAPGARVSTSRTGAKKSKTLLVLGPAIALIVLLAAGARFRQHTLEVRRQAAADSTRVADSMQTTARVADSTRAADSVAAAQRLAATSAARPADSTQTLAPAPVGTLPGPLRRGERLRQLAEARREARAAQSPGPTPVGTNPGATGLLRVRASPPSADIYVDNRRLGQGQLFDEELAAGPHRLRISAPGYLTLELPFTIEAGNTRSLGQRTLQPVPQ